MSDHLPKLIPAILLLGALLYLLIPSGTPEERAAVLCEEGEAALRYGNDEGALAAFQKAAELSPRSLDAHLGIARVQTRRRRFSDAARSLDRAVPLAGEHPDLWLALARAFRDARALEPAVAAYGKAIRLAPRNPRPLVELGDLHAAQGRDEQAEPHYRRAESLAPQSPGVHAGLGRIFLRRGQPDSAAAHLRPALAGRPEDPDLLCALAGAHLLQRAPEPAIERLLRAVEADPYHVQARYLLGRAFRMAGRVEEADLHLAAFERQKRLVDRIRTLEISAAETPTAVAYQTLSHLYAQRGQDSLAADRLRRATALDPMATAPQETGRMVYPGF